MKLVLQDCGAKYDSRTVIVKGPNLDFVGFV